MTLVALALRELAGPWPAALSVAWLLFAALLSSETGMGSGSLGDYLALVELLPVALLFRAALMVERRRREGWEVEERLRDPGGWRMPLAEFGAAVVLLVALLAGAALPPLLPRLDFAAHPPASRHMAWARVTPAGTWLVRFPAPVPAGSTLVLVADWDRLPEVPLELRGPEGRSLRIEPGIPIRWEVSADQAMAGEVSLEPEPLPGQTAGNGPRPLLGLTRLEVPRPGRHQLAALLFGLLAFHLPLLAAALCVVRLLRVRSAIAALAALGFGALGAWPAGSGALPQTSPVAWLAQAAAFCAGLLPAAGGLRAVGSAYELNFGTARAASTLAWLALGALFLMASTRRRKQIREP